MIKQNATYVMYVALYCSVSTYRTRGKQSIKKLTLSPIVYGVAHPQNRKMSKRMAKRK